MIKTCKNIIILLSVLLFIILSVVPTIAHSGRTDGSGGHRDNQNKSGLGSYHYHCGGYPAHLHQGGYCPYTDVLPSRVTVKSSKTTLGIGEEASIDALVYPPNACDTYVIWSSSNTSVVSVYNGKIKALGYGTATITAETINGKKSSIKITVKEITAKKVAVSGLPDVSDFYIGDTFNLTANIIPNNVDNPTIIWSSSNEEVATVSTIGSVNLLSDGKVEIKATASNGVIGKVSISVKERTVESVEISDDELEIFLGDKYTVKAAVTPSNATYPELVWSTEDSPIVSVSKDGVISALSCGETTITATSKNNLSDSIFVRVKAIPAKSIKIKGVEDISVGESISLSAEFTPSNTTNQNIKWSVSDPEMASINNNGTLVALKSGKVRVIATSMDGVISEYEIKVSSPLVAPTCVVGVAGVAAAIIGLLKRKRVDFK